jgi:hypothetical protein
MKFDLVTVNMPQLQTYKSTRITYKVIHIIFIAHAWSGINLTYSYNDVMI